nr:ATP-binding cassette domain-containing protein [Pseudochelatococcus contaminans]
MVALDDISLSIDSGEFICFLGPSGCGKTTLLRVIAGLEQVEQGSVLFEGRDLAEIPARKRNFGVVFQSYSLFPNMSAARNVGYGLECHGWPRAEIDARVQEMLRVVALSEHARKLPSQLSGGQQQRVALARALATNPRMLLLDEPLSALDAKVRKNLRIEIRELQRRLGITTIMVTHDQEEALAMADRIVVIEAGRIVQVGNAHQLYERPASRFVAEFIGRMNVLPVSAAAGKILLAGYPVGCEERTAGEAPRLIGIRPENVCVVTEEATDANGAIPARIRSTVYLGNIAEIVLSVGKGHEQEIVAEVPGHALRAISEAPSIAVRLPADAVKVLE